MICLANRKEDFGSNMGVRDFRSINWASITEFSFKKYANKKEVEYYIELNFIDREAFIDVQNLEIAKFR